MNLLPQTLALFAAYVAPQEFQELEEDYKKSKSKQSKRKTENVKLYDQFEAIGEIHDFSNLFTKYKTIDHNGKIITKIEQLYSPQLFIKDAKSVLNRMDKNYNQKYGLIESNITNLNSRINKKEKFISDHSKPEGTWDESSRSFEDFNPKKHRHEAETYQQISLSQKELDALIKRIETETLKLQKLESNENIQSISEFSTNFLLPRLKSILKDYENYKSDIILKKATLYQTHAQKNGFDLNIDFSNEFYEIESMANIKLDALNKLLLNASKIPNPYPTLNIFSILQNTRASILNILSKMGVNL